MGASVVTTEDLMEFKSQLLSEFEHLMVEHTHPRPKTWIRSGEVMERLGISHGTLQNLRNKKIIPCYKVEGLLFYDSLEIDDILASNKVRIKRTA
ncbi:helix-turn-helix domain-containing protein [Pricia sp. S334]|uniref:Helix-turn-helix domain-containing protein n=1 Tax=Pricia mediterranea TaxID=3076079 RepID=A0ABU3L3N7_9FLAO|nr:helix-turn-helix domain-containing protein [Pricia sp. S334]MDT7828355.1 helix-turn-helix domain-containing protein [Pricia sp. S334]